MIAELAGIVAVLGIVFAAEWVIRWLDRYDNDRPLADLERVAKYR